MATNYTITTHSIVPTEIVIDGFLSEEDNEVLYKRWKPNWPAPLEFPGGIVGISCEQVLEVPVGTFNRTFGKARGQRIRHAAEVNANA